MSTIRKIASEEYELHADGAAPFEQIWAQAEHDVLALAGRRQGGAPLTGPELRRWWRATIRMANAAAMQARVRATVERARTELQMLYLDVHEARGLDDQVPLTLDPVDGRVLEGPSAQPGARPPDAPRQPLRTAPSRELAPLPGAEP